MDKFLEREFPDVLNISKGESHEVIFIPDSYIYKDLTEKVILRCRTREHKIVFDWNFKRKLVFGWFNFLCDKCETKSAQIVLVAFIKIGLQVSIQFLTFLNLQGN